MRHLALLCAWLSVLAAGAQAGACPSLLSLVAQLPESSLFTEILSALGASEEPLGFDALPPTPPNVVPGRVPVRRRELLGAGDGEDRRFRPCPRIASPVCSVDGRVFANDCLAGNAGAEVACRGPCPCLGISAAAGEGGTASDPPGLVTEGPADPEMGPCPKIFSPVCGLDGVSYSNRCTAGGEEKVACDGRCPCRRTTLTAEGAAAGSGGSESGTVAVRAATGPSGGVNCPMVFLPVCGSNGVTYSNECVAGAGGADVACQGNCPCAGGSGGGSGGGVVRPSPGPQPGPGACIDLYDPVCGADGRTRSNLCRAQQDGVGVDCLGQCPCPNLVGALQSGGGLLLVPTDDALLAALNATDLFTADWANDTALLAQLLARHTVLASSQKGAAAQQQKPPQPSLEGTAVLTEAGQQLELVSVGGLAHVVTGPPDPQAIAMLQTATGCQLAAVLIEGALEGPSPAF